MNTYRSWAGHAAPEPHVEAAELLKGLEMLRAELGSVAEELILMMRNAGIRPPGEFDGPIPQLH